MFRSLLALLLVPLLAISSCAAAAKPQSWQEIFRRVELSIFETSYPKGDGQTTYICTGVIIDAAKGWGLTAEHCVTDDEHHIVEGITVKGIPVEVIKVSDTLALLKIPPMMGPPLELRKAKLERGEEVMGVGWGFGELKVNIRHVAEPNGPWADTTKVKTVVLDGPGIPGMSGGPVVDSDGHLVGVLQANGPGLLICLASGQDEIQRFLNHK